MEKILFSRNGLYLINIDCLWYLYKIKEMENIHQKIIIDIENIYQDIIHLYNIIDKMILLKN